MGGIQRGFSQHNMPFARNKRKLITLRAPLSSISKMHLVDNINPTTAAYTGSYLCGRSIAIENCSVGVLLDVSCIEGSTIGILFDNQCAAFREVLWVHFRS